jgi:hypothetical protein
MTEPDRCPRPELLLACAEGVLPEELALPVREHLRVCRLCAQLQQDLHDSPLAEPSLAEVERLGQRVFGVAKPRSYGGYWAAGAAAAAVLCVFALRESPAPATMPPAAKPPVAPVAAAIPVARPSYRLPLAPAPLRLPFAAALVLRGQAQQTPAAYLKALGQALEPYRAGRYPEAARALAELAGQNPQAVEPLFYEGVARLMAGDAAGALPLLERSQKTGGEALNDDIAWYIAVALERTGDWARAAAQLGEVCRSESPYREAACRALAPR